MVTAAKQTRAICRARNPPVQTIGKAHSAHWKDGCWAPVSIRLEISQLAIVERNDCSETRMLHSGCRLQPQASRKTHSLTPKQDRPARANELTGVVFNL